MSKNYLKDIQIEADTQPCAPSWRDYCEGFVNYLHKPKTIFDFKDRSVLLLLMLGMIIALQQLAAYLGY